MIAPETIYSRLDVSRLFNLPLTTIGRLEKYRVARPSYAGSLGKRFYTVSDLRLLVVALELRRYGIQYSTMNEYIEALRTSTLTLPLYDGYFTFHRDPDKKLYVSAGQHEGVVIDWDRLSGSLYTTLGLRSLRG